MHRADFEIICYTDCSHLNIITLIVCEKLVKLVQ